MADTKVKSYMTKMPHTIGEDLPLKKAMDMMEKYKCHHLPVLEGGHLVGILSERDMNLTLTMDANAKVIDAMVEEPYIVDPDDSLKSVAQEMLKSHYGSAIVKAKAGNPWGIFTLTDALEALIERL